MKRLVFIGPIGSDAPGWFIGPDGKIHRFPGWNPEQLHEISHLLRGIRELSQLKTPGVAERAAGQLMDIVRKQMDGHLEEGDVLVLG